MRRTKIVATIGPASRDPETLARMVEAGMDVARLNFSHGNREIHAENAERVRRGRVGGGAAGRDPPGPAGAEAADRRAQGRHRRAQAGREARARVRLDRARRRRGMSVSWGGLAGAVDPDDVIYLADGAIRLRVTEVREGEGEVETAVEVGGSVASRQGLNIPGSTRGLPAVPEEDLEMLRFGESIGVDLVALSFVRTAEDVTSVRRHTRLPLIAKIEKPQAVDAAEEIIRAADCVMVARGDLGIELPIEDVPIVQKRLLRIAGRLARPSITATQMLDSMVNSSRPDPRRGRRRRQRDPRRHRRGDALPGDRGRLVPGRGGRDDGLDRRADRAHAAVPRRGTKSASAAMRATPRTRSPTACAPPRGSCTWRRWSCRRCRAARPG